MHFKHKTVVFKPVKKSKLYYNHGQHCRHKGVAETFKKFQQHPVISGAETAAGALQFPKDQHPQLTRGFMEGSFFPGPSGKADHKLCGLEGNKQNGTIGILHRRHQNIYPLSVTTTQRFCL